MRILGVSLFVVAAASVAYADGPTDEKKKEDQKRADALFAEGRKLIDAHDDVGACAKFDEAIHLDPDAAGTMLNLGLCNEHLKKYKTALYWFRKAQFRAHESKLPEYETAAGDHTEQLAKVVATVKIELAKPAADVRVKIDGGEVAAVDYAHAEVDPGTHTLEASAPGFKTSRQTFDVVDRGGQTLTVTLVAGTDAVEYDPGAGRRKIAIGTAVGGGVLMLTSGVLSLYWRGKYQECIGANKEPIMPFCTVNGMMTDPGARDAGNDYNHKARYYATTLFGVGVIAVGVATYLYLSAPSKERVDRTVVVPSVGSDQVGFAAVGSF